jgi:hypothetical protein
VAKFSLLNLSFFPRLSSSSLVVHFEGFYKVQTSYKREIKAKEGGGEKGRERRGKGGER